MRHKAKANSEHASQTASFFLLVFQLSFVLGLLANVVRRSRQAQGHMLTWDRNNLDMKDQRGTH